MTLIRFARKFLPLLAALWLFGACITEDATAVDGNRACTGNDCGSGGAGGSFQQDGGGFTSDASAQDTGIPIFTLVVDSPDDHIGVSGVVRVTGRAPGFLNVEVWDAEHQHPPLAQTPPSTDATFETTVDTSLLAPGPTSWTVFAWDSPPNQPYAHSASVTLHLTIE
jgi:hypothetical protein